jgi:hypothetical protein
MIYAGDDPLLVSHPTMRHPARLADGFYGMCSEIVDGIGHATTTRSGAKSSTIQ